MNSDETYNVYRTFKVRNDDSSKEIKTEIIKERKCSYFAAREYGGCNVVELGRMISIALRS